MKTRTRVTSIPLLLAASVGLGRLGHVFADESTPETNTMPAGYDELDLKVEESGVTGMPDSVTSGRYLVKVSGPEPTEMGASGAIFLQLPEGVTPEQAYEDTQAAGDNPPPWFLDAHFGGGVSLDQGTESWSVIDLTPGTWIVTTPYGTTLGVQFEATGDMPADIPAPEANVNVELMEMNIHVSDGAFIVGENVVTAMNIGATLHELNISKIPDGTTKEQVDQLFQILMSGATPATGDIQESDAVPVATLPQISSQVSATSPVSLEAGTYLLACWIPDPETGMPHAMMGMYDVIEVK